MKILYLHQYFLTPEQGGAIRSWYLAQGMVKEGHEVVMITSHNQKEYLYKEIDGIKVHYLPVYYDNKQGFIGRGLAFVRFVRQAWKKAQEIQDVDLCYATSTPLTIGLIALWLKRKKNIPYVFEVRDLWPEAPIQMGAVKNPLLKSYLRSLEKKIYQSAEKIIALSPGMRDGVEKVCPGKPIYIIPNLSDCQFFKPEIKEPALMRKFEVDGKFVITYFGAIGKVNHLEFLLDAVKALEESRRKDVVFLVAGKGSELQRIQQLAESFQLTQIRFLGYQNKDGLKQILNITDAVYISFADKPVLETNSPNKFFDAIAAGKLVMVNTKGWIRNMAEEKECGFGYNPYAPQEFVSQLLPYVDDKSKLLSAQKNSRNLAEQHFSKDLQVARLMRILNNESRMGDATSSVYILTA